MCGWLHFIQREKTTTAAISLNDDEIILTAELTNNVSRRDRLHYCKRLDKKFTLMRLSLNNVFF